MTVSVSLADAKSKCMYIASTNDLNKAAMSPDKMLLDELLHIRFRFFANAKLPLCFKHESGMFCPLETKQIRFDSPLDMMLFNGVRQMYILYK